MTTRNDFGYFAIILISIIHAAEYFRLWLLNFMDPLSTIKVAMQYKLCQMLVSYIN